MPLGNEARSNYYGRILVGCCLVNLPEFAYLGTSMLFDDVKNVRGQCLTTEASDLSNVEVD